MTLEELANQLPNGFHDAQLCGFAVDYERKTATLDVDLCVGDPDAPDEAGREARKRVRVHIAGLVFFIVDPPAAHGAEPSYIDAGPGQPETSPLDLPALPPGVFLHWIFVSSWNSFVRIAARDAKIEQT